MLDIIIFLQLCFLVVLYCIILFFYCCYDSTEYAIKDKKQLHNKYARFIFFIIFLIYIFLIRLNRKGLELDVKKIFISWKEFILLLHITDRILLGSCVILLLIFSFLFMKSIAISNKRLCLTLYLYFSRYETFRNMIRNIVLFWSSLEIYGITKVCEYTESFEKKTQEIFLSITREIWPNSFVVIERNILLSLIPYTISFDWLTNDGLITKIFYVLPWLFVYSLLRTTLKFVLENHDVDNLIMTMNTYGLKH